MPHLANVILFRSLPQLPITRPNSVWWLRMGCKVLANGPRLRQFLANFLLCMHRNGHNCTSKLKVYTKIKLSMSVFVQDVNFCQLGHD